MAKQSLKTAQTDALRICMIQQSLTVEKLAAAGGVKRITLSNQIAKNFPSRSLRLVIESFLRLPIWSTTAEFERRQQLVSRCGFNPFTITVTELQRRVAGFKIPGRSKAKRRDAIINLIETFFQEPQQKTRSL